MSLTVGEEPGVCIALVFFVTDLSAVALLGFDMGLGRGVGRDTASLVGETLRLIMRLA